MYSIDETTTLFQPLHGPGRSSFCFCVSKCYLQINRGSRLVCQSVVADAGCRSPPKACSQMAPSCCSHPTLFAFMYALWAPFTRTTRVSRAAQDWNLYKMHLSRCLKTILVQVKSPLIPLRPNIILHWAASSCSLNPAGCGFLGIELMVALLLV